MEEKLQQLTEKIYKEGIEKAQKEAEEILASARAEAQQMLGSAQRKAEEIIQEAQEQAGELVKQTSAEMQLSARQFISAIRQEITQLIIARLIQPPLESAFSDPNFIRHLIETMFQNWTTQGINAPRLVALLPAVEEVKLKSYFDARTWDLLNNGLEVRFSDRLQGRGFRIGPADQSYVLSFTEADFEALFAEYLRPRIAQILFDREKAEAP